MFVAGMNLVRANQVNFICRDLASLYIQRNDFSTYFFQSLAKNLANGRNLDIGTSFTGSVASNVDNSNGDGLVTLTQIMYVGATTDSNCKSVGASNCVNHDSFVYLQRIQFGNSALPTSSIAGTPSTSLVTTNQGVVLADLTDTNARLPTQAQTDMTNLWQGRSNGTTALVDGQVIYLAETYFRTTGLSFGTNAKGVYAKFYF